MHDSTLYIFVNNYSDFFYCFPNVWGASASYTNDSSSINTTVHIPRTHTSRVHLHQL